MTHALLLFALLGATVFNDTFDRANQMYSQGDYASAINLYEQLVRDGVVDANVFYNLGNAYYRDNQLGAAITNYERALHLSPHFEAAARNLDVCIAFTKQQRPRPLPPAWEQSMLFWHAGFAPRTVFSLAVACWVLFWGVLAVRYWRVLPYSRLAASLLFLLACLFGLSSWAKYHPMPLAVASAEQVPVRYGTGENEAVRFELGLGDRVVIEGRSGDWVRVRTSDGERGWTKLSALALVGPPYERPSSPESSSTPGSGGV
ncbi:MAG: tetratricopeptide repeat protein [Candidatus Hydrogenedentes bacterium]|nr:tetratricopeptide repeat protein [Candidatus Hydrogenedentota bacterium]